MNTRQQRYKKNRLTGMNEYNAARAAGYSESYSKGARPEKCVKVCLADAFEQAGLTDKAIIDHALQGLNASKVISAVVVNQKNRPTSLDDGELFDANEKTNDFIDVPDWTARHKYFETILKLTNRLKEKDALIQINQYTQIWNRTADKAKDVDANGRVHLRNQKEMPA